MNKMNPHDFRLVKGKPADFEILVNKALAEGYELHGNVIDYVFPTTRERILMQPMVKHND